MEYKTEYNRFPVNDQLIIKIALTKDYLYEGWEQLKNRCESIMARNEIGRIETIKWRQKRKVEPNEDNRFVQVVVQE